MSIVDRLETGEGDWCPPFPEPRAQTPGLLSILNLLRRNPIEAWSRDHFENPVVRHRLRLGDMLVVSDPAAIRRLLVENTDNYQKDRLQKRVMGRALEHGLLMVEGATWRMQRRGLAQLFSRRMVEAFAPAMLSATQDMLARWRHAAGPLLVADEMGRLTLDILVRTIFSNGLGDEPEAMRSAMRIYFDQIGKIDPLDFLDVPDWAPRPLKWKVRASLAYFDRTIDRVIASRQALLDAGGIAPPDMLTSLLCMRDFETGEGLTTEEIRSNILTFVAAGHETTSNTISWALFLLSQSPRWARQVLQEAMHADGMDANVQLEALPQTRAVIEEALRLYPPIVAISRVALREDRLAGEDVPPGAMVIVSPYVLHRHRKLWERPNTFDPTRFLLAERCRIDKFAWLPFGIGPRICIGSAFALQEAAIVVSQVVRHFELTPVTGSRVEPLQRVTLRPSNGLPMIVRPR